VLQRDALMTALAALDPVQQLYAIPSNVGPNDLPGAAADAQQIKQELDSGTATEDGTATVGPANPQDPSAGTDTTTENWLPATAANIANAQLAQIPAGYTQVSQTTLEKENPAGR
jgi:hypothetical protein